MAKKQLRLIDLSIVTILLLMLTNALTYVLLLSKNEEWKSALSEKEMHGSNTRIVADALTEHVYYDGDTISVNMTAAHYSRTGKLIGNEALGEVLRGEKVVLLLSPNCCSSCAREEIASMLELSKKIGREHIVMIADFPLHTQRGWTTSFGEGGYYEADVEHLGLKGSPTRQTPVVMLTQDGRVKTSFVVGQQTSSYTDSFHEFIVDYFKEAR